MIENVVEYLYQIPRFARTGGLEQTQERLRLLGNPEKSFRYIHVAGTNGKGSTCAYLESALRHMGFKTGLFTSPHLIRINERIRINNVEISDEAFIKAFHKVKELIDMQMQQGIAHPTFFEFIYLMLYFFKAIDTRLGYEIGQIFRKYRIRRVKEYVNFR